MILVIMGVSGSGKSTIGKLLASELDWTFVEGDDFHPAANVEKYGMALLWMTTTADHGSKRLASVLQDASKRGENVVLACSALKHAYQHYLAHFAPEAVRYVYLSGSEG